MLGLKLNLASKSGLYEPTIGCLFLKIVEEIDHVKVGRTVFTL